MATFFYQSQYSTQRWLGERKLCPVCNGSKPKGDFKLFSGIIQCLECITESVEENS